MRKSWTSGLLFIVASFALVACMTKAPNNNLSPNRGVAAVGGMEMSDPYIWLEDTQNPETMKWVTAHNAKSAEVLEKDARFTAVANDIRTIITAKDRIPYPTLIGRTVRNFWQDQDHRRGILRQTSWAEYQKEEPRWEIILDIDELNKREQKSWVYVGLICLPPEFDRCLLKLSDGGRDEFVVREFQVSTKSFVTGGFEMPAAKSDIAWIDKNTLFVGTDFGPDSLTTSGYPREVRIWKRGTPLKEAKLVFSGEKSDVSVDAWRDFGFDSNAMYIRQSPNFFESKVFLFDGAKTQPLPFPTTADFKGAFKGQLLAMLRRDWQTPDKTFKAGSVVSIPRTAVGSKDVLKTVESVWEPDDRSAFSDLRISKDFITLNVLRNVRSELHRVLRKGTKWLATPIPFAKDGSAMITDTNVYDNHVFISYETFNVPASLYYNVGLLEQGLRKVKSLTPKFDASDVVVEQFEATSTDGTKVPYFVVHNKGMKLDGTNPTLLYGYGGFEVNLDPFYLGAIGKVWLNQGGVYVLANIRGGGEFGPRWHEAAMKENRQRSYDDFASIARDLIARQITSARRLGIQGGSNGGLLVGVSFTQHPELFNAVVCESALLDMIRYTQMPPGASWIGEYGDPAEPKMAEIIARYSPYQNVQTGRSYPEVFFHVSTADDRVQPGHSRKMTARLEEKGHKVLFYENTEGGHGGAADLEQKVKKLALEYIYLYQKLRD